MSLLIYFVVCVILFSVAYWVVNQLLPEPARKFANILLVVIAAIVVCYMLIGFVGGGLPSFGVRHIMGLMN